MPTPPADDPGSPVWCTCPERPDLLRDDEDVWVCPACDAAWEVDRTPRLVRAGPARQL